MSRLRSVVAMTLSIAILAAGAKGEPAPPRGDPTPAPSPRTTASNAGDDWKNVPPPDAPASPFSSGAQNQRPREAATNVSEWGQFSQTSGAPDLVRVAPESLGQGGSRGPIELRIAPDTRLSVRYELFNAGQRYRYELQPGQHQRFSEDRLWGIRFHRGTEDEFLGYRLLEGVYEFEWTDRGWELFLVQSGTVLPPLPPRRLSADAASNSGAPPPPQPISQ